jgi:hypothetical protein
MRVMSSEMPPWTGTVCPSRLELTATGVTGVPVAYASSITRWTSSVDSG